MLAQLILCLLQLLLRVEDVLALTRQLQAETKPAALLRVHIGHLHEFVQEIVQLFHATLDALQDYPNALVLDVEPIQHAVDLVEQA